MTFRRIAAMCLAASACSGGGSTRLDAGAPDAGAADATLAPDAVIPPALGPVPEGFQWGTAIAPYQVEGGLHATDWHVWESLCASCSDDHADDGPDFWNRYADDIDLAADLGTNSLRIGIEWGRIFPTRESFPAAPDAAAVARYHAIIDAAQARGLRVMVTLHHFSTPIWLADPSRPTEVKGWEDPATGDVFAEWCGWAAREFGGDIDWWVTLNEPIAYVLGGWIGAVFPPGKTLAIPDALRVADHLIHAHAKAYDAIHAADTVDADHDGTAAWVSFSTHNRVFLPRTPTSAADMAAAETLRHVNNILFLEAVTRGNIDWNFDGDLDDEGDVRSDPALADRVDYVALQYYGVTLVVASPGLEPFAIPLMNDLYRFGLDAPVTDFGTVVYPEGFRVVLDELDPYGLPIIVTENGLADAADVQRPRFLIDHLYALRQAIADGIDVRGYYYWSLIDNFEWAAGFCPRFGLVHVDFASANKTRTRGAGAEVYQEIIEAGSIPSSLFARYPSYPPASLTCARTGF